MKNYKVLFLILAFFLAQACTKEFGLGCVEGNGQIERRMVEINEALTKIDLAMSGNVYVQEGPQSIEIEASSDIIDRIIAESEISGENWTIELDGCYNGPDINVWLTLPQFIAMDITGSGNITSLDTLRNLTTLNLEIDGSGDLDLLLLDVEKLDTEIQGSGNITVISRDITRHSYDLQGSGNITSKFRKGSTSNSTLDGNGNIELIGTVDESNINMDGSGNIFHFDLCATDCNISLDGSGNINVKVEDDLSINLDGSGNICYRGQPTITSNIDGTGNIRDCN